MGIVLFIQYGGTFNFLESIRKDSNKEIEKQKVCKHEEDHQSKIDDPVDILVWAAQFRVVAVKLFIVGAPAFLVGHVEWYRVNHAV